MMCKRNQIKKVYFIGIGGIMMSALARYFLALGAEVEGSDRSASELLKELESEGAKINRGHNKKNIDKNFDLVVYTVAIAPDNPELVRARELNLKTKTVFQVLGEIAANKFTIVVSGMHGKSTTTAMAALCLEQAGLDPTVFIGTKVKEWRSNFRFGTSKYFLAEACEYKDNFLNFKPDILVINNIEAEHLDYFHDLAGVQRSFTQLISQLKAGGVLIYNGDNALASQLAAKFKGHKISFGIGSGAIQAAKLSQSNGQYSFQIKQNKFHLQLPGQHNVYNALACLALAEAVSIEPSRVSETLADFGGVWRRFEYKGRTKSGVDVYDDYAHHPTEISATLAAAAQKFKGRKMWLVFQPHLYSRSVDFMPDFAAALNQADNLILAPIYAAREENQWGVSSQAVVELINKSYPRKNPALFMAGFKEIADYLKNNLQTGDVVMTLGAGEAFKVGEMLLGK